MEREVLWSWSWRQMIPTNWCLGCWFCPQFWSCSRVLQWLFIAPRSFQTLPWSPFAHFGSFIVWNKNIYIHFLTEMIFNFYFSPNIPNIPFTTTPPWPPSRSPQWPLPWPPPWPPSWSPPWHPPPPPPPWSHKLTKLPIFKEIWMLYLILRCQETDESIRKWWNLFKLRLQWVSFHTFKTRDHKMTARSSLPCLNIIQDAQLERQSLKLKWYTKIIINFTHFHRFFSKSC